jgi:DNA-binding response OmpR family regulator
MSDKSPVVLVVDDNGDLQVILRRILEMEGFRVLTAGNGQEGLALLKDSRPDLLLLDIRMPGMDGLQFLERARRCSDAFVIMLTAARYVALISRALSTGADDYITKPFRAAELVAWIRSKLRRSGGRASSAGPGTAADRGPWGGRLTTG